MYGGSGMNLFAQKPVICHMVGVIGSMSFEGTWHYADHSASWPFSYTVEVKEDWFAPERFICHERRRVRSGCA